MNEFSVLPVAVSEDLDYYTSDYGFHYNKLLRLIANTPLPLTRQNAMEILDRAELLEEPINPEEGNFTWTQILEILGRILRINTLYSDVRPTIQDITVYSGQSDRFQNLERQDSIKFAGFLSTTFDYETAVDYIRKKACCLFEIGIPAGSRILYDPEQDQVILSPGTQLEITKVSRKKDLKAYHAKVVGTDQTVIDKVKQWLKIQ